MNNLQLSSDMADWRSQHAALIALVNGEFPSRGQRLLCEVWQQPVFNAAAKLLVQDKPMDAALKESGALLTVRLPPCQNNATSVVQMKRWLNRHLADDLYCAILHGSLGNNEVVNYSDFDALVIIKDEVFSDSARLVRVARYLFQARQIMYQHDPLQHHGWFVLPEQALLSWPEDYLPIAVLKNASQMSLVGIQEIQVKPMLLPGANGRQFNQLSQSIEHNLLTGVHLDNLYHFKGMLSKVLLLPAMYVQARDNQGVFKRESFDLARADFTAANWAVVETASNIRRNWSKVSPVFPKAISMRPGLLGNLWRRYQSCRVPASIHAAFGDGEQQAVLHLIEEMQAKLTKSVVRE